ncbi:septal ring lytic transglycosylase RlpA family protein [Terrarubrum flagellatum]|uniref:septal ring lytic transglycosylase RlpA family protein n=1 Tax=Terrirubrum flagellatum TaxID=2895980 RepID=UPI0031456CEF
MDKPEGARSGFDKHGWIAVRMSLAICAGLTVANCAQTPGGRSYSAQERREIGAFASSRYGRASERVVADGEPVPKGGGRDLIGRPYSVAGRTYVPYEKRPGHTEVGMASWYGVAFHGRRTANGEVFDRQSISAAHKTMPLPSYARVSNIVNGRSIVVRVNDRGPYHGGRIIDVSQRVADLLDFRSSGSGRVKVEYLGRASLAGSDDRKLVATLRTDGDVGPGFGGFGGQSRVMVASLDEGGQSFPTADAGTGGYSETPAVSVREDNRLPVAVTPRVAPAPATTALAMAPVAQQPAVSAPAPAPVGVAIALPLPPERPFDLGTIPHAATPVMSAVPLAPTQNAVAPPLPPVRARATVAALFYAEPAKIVMRFEKSDPFAALKPQAFRPLKSVSSEL